MRIEFTVPKNPKALKRHRMTKTGHCYDPSAEDKKTFLWMAERNKPEKPLGGPIRLTIDFCFDRPNYHFNSKGLKKDAPVWKDKKPDMSNCVKFIEDALNGVFYKDDAQIVWEETRKFYTDQACVHVMIETL